MTSTALTDLQLSLMKALWQLGQGSVADVQDRLAADGKTLAQTTVATMLQRLSKQGWVSSEKVGRQLLYKPCVERQEAARGALKRLLGGFFAGSSAALTAQLLESEHLTAKELDEMRKLIAKKGR
jgi:BlaI family transcriptional regulator, penicillinase repressor